MAATKAKKPAKAPDEFEKLTRWRFDALVALGLQPDQAIALVDTPDIVHKAQALVDRGCPPGIIVVLLAGD